MATAMDSHRATWFQLACQRSVIARALKYALVVGALLVAINHGDALSRGDVTFGRLCRILLTFLVPYGVVTFASVSAAREARWSQSNAHTHTHNDED